MNATKLAKILKLASENPKYLRKIAKEMSEIIFKIK